MRKGKVQNVEFELKIAWSEDDEGFSQWGTDSGWLVWTQGDDPETASPWRFTVCPATGKCDDLSTALLLIQQVFDVAASKLFDGDAPWDLPESDDAEGGVA